MAQHLKEMAERNPLTELAATLYGTDPYRNPDIDYESNKWHDSVLIAQKTLVTTTAQPPISRHDPVR